MRIRPSCHARLRPSKNSLYLSCIIPRALFKPFKQMGWKWRYSEGNHQAINKQNYFFFSNKSSCECFLIYCLCQSLLWAKDEICKDYFRGFLGASPPEAKSYSFLTVLPTTYVLFRLCQYVLQFTADNVEYFWRYMPNTCSRRFFEKKKIYIYFSTHFSRILSLQVRQRLFIITLNNLQEAVFPSALIFFFNRADKNKSTVSVLCLIFFFSHALLYE